jgi:hypothetical protein
MRIYIRLNCSNIRVKTNDICALQILISNETDRNAVAVCIVSRSYLYFCGLVNWLFCHVILNTRCATFWFCAPFSIFFNNMNTSRPIFLSLHADDASIFHASETLFFSDRIIISLKTRRHCFIVLESGTANVYSN